MELSLELVIVFGWESLAATVRKRREVAPGMAQFGFLLIGLTLGAVSGGAFPNRLLRNDWLALLTVFVNPLLSGMGLSRYGQMRRSMGHQTTHLATFYGGAALALGVSVGRLFVVFCW